MHLNSTSLLEKGGFQLQERIEFVYIFIKLFLSALRLDLHKDLGNGEKCRSYLLDTLPLIRTHHPE